jgi:hypothetical protein
LIIPLEPFKDFRKFTKIIEIQGAPPVLKTQVVNGKIVLTEVFS